MVRHILKTEWDPIPGSPEDEYDSYVSKICSMVFNENAGSHQIANYLSEVERVSMGYRDNGASTSSLEEIGKKVIKELSKLVKKPGQ